MSIDPNLSNNGSETVEISASIIQPFINKLPTVLFEAFLAIFPIFFIYMLFQLMYLKQPKRAFRRVIFGLLFAFIGLVLFMLGVHAGFLDVGRIVGSTLSEPDNKFLLIAIAFGLGLFTVLAEPAVSVLTHQIENVTSGYIKRRVHCAINRLCCCQAVEF